MNFKNLKSGGSKLLKKESPIRTKLDFGQTMEKHYSALRICVLSLGSFPAFGILKFWDIGILEH